MSPELISAIADYFTEAALSLNYGLTETYRTSSLPPSMVSTHPASVGYAINGVMIKVIDPEGQPVKNGHVGEIVHMGAGTFEAYWQDYTRTNARKKLEKCPNGQYLEGVNTGDFGYFGSNGELYVLGRKTRTVKTSDVMVQLDFIEKEILATGVVASVAVFSRMDRLLGESIEAAVVLNDNGIETTEQLSAALKNKLSRFELPRKWYSLASLPQLPNLKVDYEFLKKIL